MGKKRDRERDQALAQALVLIDYMSYRIEELSAKLKKLLPDDECLEEIGREARGGGRQAVEMAKQARESKPEWQVDA